MKLRTAFGYSLLWLCVWCAPAWAQGKLALVIGNGAYQHATELPNPPNDAGDMVPVLQGMGFDVVTAINATKQDMDQRIREFAEKAETADVALFFYAGHGMQVNGVNYLIPVDAKLDTQTALDFETVNAENVIRYMSSDTRVGLVFLDACRDNPLSRRFQKKSRSTAVGNGLAVRTSSDPNLLIAFATAPGEVALDGNGRNSPFTTALIKHLPQQQKELRSVLTDVKADVQASTGREQIPWSHDNLITNLYLNGEPGKAVEIAPVAPPAQTDNKLMEARAAWEAVKDSDNIAAMEVVANMYPGTTYGELAAARVAEMQEDERRAAEDERKAEAMRKAEADAERKAEAKRQAEEARRLAALEEQQQQEEPPPPKPRASGGNLKWGVILGSFPKSQTSKARARLKQARANGLDAQLIDTSNYGRLTPGLFAVVIGAPTRDSALGLAEEAKSYFADAYAKQLQ